MFKESKIIKCWNYLRYIAFFFKTSKLVLVFTFRCIIHNSTVFQNIKIFHVDQYIQLRISFVVAYSVVQPVLVRVGVVLRLITVIYSRCVWFVKSGCRWRRGTVHESATALFTGSFYILAYLMSTEVLTEIQKSILLFQFELEKS